jgi:hypothetical protein
LDGAPRAGKAFDVEDRPGRMRASAPCLDRRKAYARANRRFLPVSATAADGLPAGWANS